MSEATLYFTEWTMPDGSKRRPIVERVPECRAREDEWSLMGVVDPQLALDMLYQWRHNEDYDPPHYESPETAAALCRCACEDWLLSRWCVTHLPQQKNDWILMISWTDAGASDECQAKMFDGPTIHHALIAACHAVADAQGVSH